MGIEKKMEATLFEYETQDRSFNMTHKKYKQGLIVCEFTYKKRMSFSFPLLLLKNNNHDHFSKQNGSWFFFLETWQHSNITSLMSR